MLSSHKFLLVMVEVEEDLAIEAEEEIHQEVEEPVQQIQVEAATAKIQVKISLIAKGLPQDDNEILTPTGILSMVPPSKSTQAQQGGLQVTPPSSIRTSSRIQARTPSNEQQHIPQGTFEVTPFTIGILGAGLSSSIL
eukprot:Gb_13727 [translate_table: standard]